MSRPKHKQQPPADTLPYGSYTSTSSCCYQKPGPPPNQKGVNYTTYTWIPPPRTYTYYNATISLTDECFAPGVHISTTVSVHGTKPACTWCKTGSYCPSPDIELPCPPGFFCWEYTTEPYECGYPTDFTYEWSQAQCGNNGGSGENINAPNNSSSSSPRGGSGGKKTGPSESQLRQRQRPASVEGTTRILVLVVGTLLLYALITILKKIHAKVLGRNYKQWKQAQLRKLKGETAVKVKGSTFPARPGITFTYKDLSLEVIAAGSSKLVVDKVSGEVPAATMTAVMGPSGAGKTSFMNVLCDRAGYGNVSGELTLNGKPDRISNHRDIMGFVPQDDIVHEDLTVRENLLYAAILRLPLPTTTNNSSTKSKNRWCRQSRTCSVLQPSSRKEYYDEYVDRVLEMLQLGHIQHSIVGSVEKRGISGGQKKRVNIGLELVADPDVLFLDEPTSGLDSTSAEIILAALKELSRLGRTIIMVIHQPRYSIFSSMDNVIFLGPGGKTVYSGNPVDATDYFEMLGFISPPGVNRADYMMDIIGGTGACCDNE